MDLSSAEQSDEFTVEDAIYAFEMWFKNAPRGFAMATYDGFVARQRFLETLKTTLAHANIKALFCDLTPYRTPREALSHMADALDQSDTVVFYGFDWNLTATADNARDINYSRERLALTEALQLWVVPPAFRRALLEVAYDIFSWFLPNIRIAHIDREEPPAERQLLMPHVANDKPVVIPPNIARIQAEGLVRRFRQGLQAGNPLDAWPMMTASLNAYQSGGLAEEGNRSLDEMISLIADRLRIPIDNWASAVTSAEAMEAAAHTRYRVGRFSEAANLYGSAISIMDGIRAVLEPRGEWSPSYRNDLAGAYMNRGVAYRIQIRLEEAVGDYGSAISIMDGIRAVLEPRGEWSPSYRNDLAGAYVNRANAFQGQNRLEEAVGDYGSAISIMDGIRAVLEPRGEWSPSYRNDLAAAYMNRGVAYRSQNRLEEAVGDYGSAISIMDGIRAVLEPRGEWSPSYRNDLAGAYMNRGVAYRIQIRLEEAVGDYGSAISIMDGIRAVLEPRGEWSPSYRNDLAGAYMNRGVAYRSQNRLEEAVGDYGSAISIMDGIRAVLEPRGEWSPSYRNDLAGAYMNRGVAYYSQNRLEEAVGDGGSAISIMDGIRAVLEPRGEWSPSYRNDLAGAYMNRGVAYRSQNRLEEAVGDYGSAISIMDGIRAVLEPRGEWSPSYRNDLAAAYVNRANAFQGQNRLEDAAHDYERATKILEPILADNRLLVKQVYEAARSRRADLETSS